MIRHFRSCIGVLGLGALLLGGWGGLPWIVAQNVDDVDIAEQQKGVEVLVQGPVHEAFAQPIIRRQGASAVVPKEPPAPIPELPAEQKPEGNHVIWISGYWAWEADREDFLWVSGIWRDAPPGQHWVPGYWEQTDGGWRWISGYWTDDTEVQLLPIPPNPVEEAVPPAPNNESVYVPGNWVYYQDDYRWQGGYWINNRPGWTWISPMYTWTPGGYVYTGGYWDYAFARRGLLFAPVAVDPYWYGRSGWYYRPGNVLSANSLLANLFIGLAGNQYYYGNYYGPRYSGLGFSPWVNWTGNNRYYDPLYGYARWQNRNNPQWEANMRANYQAQQNGTLAGPPRTMAQLLKIQNRNQNNTLPLIAPLSKINEVSEIKVQAVPKAQLAETHKAALQMQNVSQLRRKAEIQARTSGSVKTGTPTKINLGLSKATVAKSLDGEKAPPPKPQLPQPVTRSLTNPGKGPAALTQPKGADNVPDKTPLVKPPQDKPATKIIPPKGGEVDKPKPPPKGKPKAATRPERSVEVESPPSQRPMQVEPRPRPPQQRPPQKKGKDG
jgi:hypothetical protein